MKIQTFLRRNNYVNAAISALCDPGFSFQEKRENLNTVSMASWSVRDVVSAYWLNHCVNLSSLSYLTAGS